MAKIKEEPNSYIAEQSVLGSMMINRDALIKSCDLLSSDEFYYKKHSVIFNVLKDFKNKDTPFDMITLTNEFINKDLLKDIGGVEYLSELLTLVPTTSNIENYIKIVKEKSMLRRLIKTATDIVTDAYDHADDFNMILDEAERKILSVVKDRRSTEIKDIISVLMEAKNDIELLSTQKNDTPGISTGWEYIDKKTTGFREGQLIVVAARPGVGKTAWACNLATNVAINSDKTVAIFNLEMDAKSLVSRMLACVGHINGKKIMTGDMDGEWDKLNEAICRLSDTNIYIDDIPGITIGEIRNKCRILANSPKGLDLVIIDYLQLISTTTNYAGNRQQEVADISRALKLLALELKVPVIALSQLKRSNDKKTKNIPPRLEDLRESGAIEQDADIVAFLYNPEEEKTKGQLTVDINFIIEKNRNGETGHIPLRFKKDISKFFSIIGSYSAANKGDEE